MVAQEQRVARGELLAHGEQRDNVAVVDAFEVELVGSGELVGAEHVAVPVGAAWLLEAGVEAELVGGAWEGGDACPDFGVGAVGGGVAPGAAGGAEGAGELVVVDGEGGCGAAGKVCPSAGVGERALVRAVEGVDRG